MNVLRGVSLSVEGRWVCWSYLCRSFNEGITSSDQVVSDHYFEVACEWQMSCASPNLFSSTIIIAFWGAYCENMDEYLKPATKSESGRTSARMSENLSTESRGNLKSKIASSYGVAEKKFGEQFSSEYLNILVQEQWAAC